MGRRREQGTPPYELEPGEYVKWITTNVDETEEWDVWYVRAPAGGPFFLANVHTPDSNGRAHHVEEHEGGTISVLPQPGNSNSIMAPGEVWHGYLRRGEWVTEA